ncbi:uncharacterized protein SOCE26_038640 [Sorangium cellulosum]|uniref:Protein kinase domain-containing protein n=1 Tax=Sorangium cellulosum TaxID=56 RepID=A0A2L0ET32_SORCE|nr:uncharacterized protein SOCE26_038640 [Sorangium cellulosum]
MLEALAGTGGMGEIYRARDLERGQDVAVKLLRDPHGAGDARFQREARLLEELVHPRIVRYVAHGSSPSGAPYLVMEWLEGEDLSRTLARGRLGVEESVQIARAVAEALGAAHARGIVHRDLKPSNVFLEQASPRQVKLLDFGIAWPGGGTRITRTGALLGTPGYMAPEQTRSMGVVDARADIFALGCVLFECLAGEPPFSGDNLISVLAKIVCDEPPRLGDLRDDVPEPLAALCAQMLSKDPAARPRDGDEAAAALAAIERGHGLAPAGGGGAAPAPPAALTATERRPAAVLLVGAASGAAFAEAETLPGALFQEVSARGAHVELLQGGAAVVTMLGRGTATDLAAQAAGAALALRRDMPCWPMALSLGWSAPTGQMPLRDTIDRAARLLSAPGPREAGRAFPIALDDLLAGLLDARFELREHDDGFFLVGERELNDGGRTLLGKPTSCVGRDGELRSLEAMFEACLAEPAAQPVLVTAPPGVGKTRLGQEFLRRAQRRAPGASVWVGRGDPLRAHSPFGLLAQAIKGACGILEGEPLAVRRDRLLARVARGVPEPDRQRVAEFVGEIVGAPFPDDGSPLLRAARRDAQLMNEQMQRAFVELVRAACAAGPVVVVLEDLHWGDLATTSFLDVSLRQLAGEPLFLLALARPEIADLFPGLWAEHGVHEIRLKDLGKKASERLARQVLGEGASPGTIERIVALADGNAFYLEELLRAAAEGRRGELPPTVVAMVQFRLAKLDGEARRLLRAASVFGETCWASGVEALVGAPARAGLAALVRQELLVKRPASRFAGEEELGFRHALLREGAYTTLTEEDAVLGHRLAGQWLEDHGEGDALVLAEHFDKGAEPARAARYWLRAAEIAHRGDDVEAALAIVSKGLSGEVPPDIELAYLGLQCDLGLWRLDATGTTLLAAERLMREAPSGSRLWAQGLFATMTYTYLLGMYDRFEATIDTLVEAEPAEDALGGTGFALLVGLYGMLLRGSVERREPLVQRARALLERHGERDPYVAALHYNGIAMVHLLAREEPWSALLHIDAARALYLRGEHTRGASGLTLVRGFLLWTLGAARRAEEELLGVAGPDETYGAWSSFRPFTLAHIASERGDLDRARGVAEALIASGRARRVAIDEGRGRWSLGEVLCRAGELEEAGRELDAALALLSESSRIDVPGVLSTRAALCLRQGRAAEALAAAEDGLSRHKALGACGFFRGARLRLVHAECLEAAGQRDAAREAIARARDRLLCVAEEIADPGYRQSFLEQVPENRRTIELALEWLGGGDAAGAS